LYMGVLPQAQIAMRNPSFGRDCCSFDHQQAEAAECETAVVDEVIVAGMTICCRVLAHRTEGEAVAQRDAALRERLEYFAHCSVLEGGVQHDCKNNLRCRYS
jgi:hypothetical protein